MSLVLLTVIAGAVVGGRYSDRLLAEAARRLVAAADEGAGVARHGGDEFLLLLPRVPAPVADDGSTHVCTTAWCPVCQVVGFVRDHPEAIASVTHSAAQLARSLKDLVDTALAPQEEQ